MQKKSLLLFQALIFSLLTVLPVAAKTEASLPAFQEKRLSEKLKSPLRTNFEHIANYWLENYAIQTLNQTPEEIIAIKTQTLLLPVLTKGQHEKTVDPLKRISLLKELQFINTPDKRSIFTGLDKTITYAGKVSLFNLIATDQTDWLAIKERQNFIKFLVDSPTLLKEIQSHLQTIKNHEVDSIGAILKSEQAREKRELDRLELQKQGIGGMIANSVMSFIETICKVDGINTIIKFVSSIIMTLTVVSIPILFIRLFFQGGIPTIVFAYEVTKSVINEAPILIIYPIYWIGLSIYTAIMLYLRLKDQINNFRFVQSASQTFRQALSLNELLSQHEETKSLYPELLTAGSSTWQSLIAKAQSSTFNPDAYPVPLFMHYGRVENSINQYMEVGDEIGQITRFYGEIDAYASLAQMYLDHQNTRNEFDEKIIFSFSKFTESSTDSILHINNFWHPMIPTNRVRPSSLELGGTSRARDVVITGPNAGGKSVNLKALFANLLLAQATGLSSSESLTFTPFTKLIGRFKGVDDTASDKSKFMLEAIEMTGLMKDMMELKPTEHAFVITDELFTGTELGPAISLSMELCAQIAKMKNVIYILATHYKQLTDLSSTTGGVFENYKVDVFKDKMTHKLIYPYKLAKGIGSTNVAFDIFLEQLEKQGVEDPVLKKIIQRAKDRQESIESSL
jgi:hypothetical protein